MYSYEKPQNSFKAVSNRQRHMPPPLQSNRQLFEKKSERSPAQKNEWNPPSPTLRSKTGLPENLKAQVEHISGIAMDNVQVHYNAQAPLKMGVLAFTQGTDIHVAPGKEEHLPHEMWHVVQQAQGRVSPKMRINGYKFNIDSKLEYEANNMASILRNPSPSLLKAHRHLTHTNNYPQQVTQPLLKIENMQYDDNTPIPQKLKAYQHDLYSLIHDTAQYDFRSVNDAIKWLINMQKSNDLAPQLHKDICKKLEQNRIEVSVAASTTAVQLIDDRYCHVMCNFVDNSQAPPHWHPSSRFSI